MKKFFFSALLTILSINSYTQSCSEREAKLGEVLNGFSAGFLYNTYALIGSLADGFNSNAYDENTVTGVLDAQKKLLSNLATLVKEKDSVLNQTPTKNYLESVTMITKEMETQVDLLLKMIKNNTQKNRNAYTAQRSKSWKDISKLMGIDE